MATGKLTQRIRDAIDASGLGRGAMAEQAGVAEATLGQFMAGEAELSSAALDRLAEVLGLDLIATAAVSARPAVIESRPFAVPRKLDWSQTKWTAFASFLARDAHENHGESGQGMWYIGDAGVLCLYRHQSPDSVPIDREVELAAFRGQMAAAGIRELAFATFPPGGDGGSRRTWAILLDASPEQGEMVVRALQESP